MKLTDDISEDTWELRQTALRAAYQEEIEQAHEAFYRAYTQFLCVDCSTYWVESSQEKLAEGLFQPILSALFGPYGNAVAVAFRESYSACQILDDRRCVDLHNLWPAIIEQIERAIDESKKSQNGGRHE